MLFRSNDVLNALSEATTAFHRVPELERELKATAEDRDFTKLELEEARAEIERLRLKITDLTNEVQSLADEKNLFIDKVDDLTSRNTALDTSVNELVTQVNDLNQIRRDLNLRIDNLKEANTSLAARLDDAKSYGARLADTLKSIGASIVAAVAEPEVSDSKPFPVSDSVGLLASADAKSNREPVQPNPSTLVEPTVPAVEVTEDPESSPGCHAYRYW